MLPTKITDLLTNLNNATANNEIVWQYNDETTQVAVDLREFIVTISYYFDTIEEVGSFKITYYDKTSNKEYFFHTSQLYNDYEIARQLFDNAQSSEINIDWNTVNIQQ